MAANTGWVAVGSDHDTGAFAVESIRHWWDKAGARRLPPSRLRLGAGTKHGQVTDLDGFGIAILSFSDPDGVHLELTAPL